MVAQGWLYDIGKSGARIFLNEPLPLHARYTLDVHLRNAQSKIVTIRFKSTVTGICCGPPYEVALRFLGRGDFIRGKGAHFREGSQMVRAKGSDRWVH